MSQPVRDCTTNVEKCFAIRNTRRVLPQKICRRKVPKNKLFRPRRRQLHVKSSGRPSGLQPKHSDIAELSPLRSAKALAATTLWTPRFRCAPLGVTALLSFYICTQKKKVVRKKRLPSGNRIGKGKRLSTVIGTLIPFNMSIPFTLFVDFG